MSVLEHVLFFCRLKGVPKDHEKQAVEDLLNEVRLSHLRDALAGTLSGGEKRRLSIAISFAGTMSVILLDEPTVTLMTSLLLINSL